MLPSSFWASLLPPKIKSVIDRVSATCWNNNYFERPTILNAPWDEHSMMFCVSLDLLLYLAKPSTNIRRLRGDLIEVYKITNNLYDSNCTSCLKLWKDVATAGQLRGHSKKLFLQRSRLCVREHSFALRVVPIWNKLTEKIVSAPDIDTFKNRLDKLMLNQEIYYNDFKAEMTL